MAKMDETELLRRVVLGCLNLAYYEDRVSECRDMRLMTQSLDGRPQETWSEYETANFRNWEAQRAGCDVFYGLLRSFAEDVLAVDRLEDCLAKCRIIAHTPTPLGEDTDWPAFKQDLNLIGRHARRMYNERLRRKPSGNHTQNEVNVQVREILVRSTTAGKTPTITEIAVEIGCSTGLIHKTSAWTAYREQTKKGRKPKMVQLSHSNITRDEALKELTHEQAKERRSDQGRRSGSGERTYQR